MSELSAPKTGFSIRPRIRLGSALVLIAVFGVALVTVILPTWRYYRLPVKSRLLVDNLNRRLDMPFASPVPFSMVVKHVIASSQGPRGPGIPVYVDPVGLKDAGVGMETMVALSSRGDRIGTSLGRVLKPLGLGYYVQDGMLTITSSKALSRVPADFPRSDRGF